MQLLFKGLISSLTVQVVNFVIITSVDYFKYLFQGFQIKWNKL